MLRGCCIAVLALMAISVRVVGADRTDQRARAALEMFLARPAVVHAYSASRRLDATGGAQRGWLEVRTDFAPASGLFYEVTAEGGSGFIRSRVLRSLLDEEQRVIARGATAAIALTTDNYRFTPERVDDEAMAVVTIRPLRKERSLMAGRMVLTLEGELRRIEGRLARNPSFWVTGVDVVRSYRRINGVTVPVALDTTAHLRLFGSSVLAMTYRYSHIDGRVADDDRSR